MTFRVSMRIARGFLRSAGLLLFVTAAAKLISAVGSAYILRTLDPVLGIQFRADFWIAGSIEFLIALTCLFGGGIALRTGLVAWWSTNLILYRFALWGIGWHHSCPCLGNLTDAIHVSPQMADNLMKAVLAYLLIGSYGILFHLWWKNRKPASGGLDAGSRNSQLEAGS